LADSGCLVRAADRPGNRLADCRHSRPGSTSTC
jgi:hypothetical protein